MGEITLVTPGQGTFVASGAELVVAFDRYYSHSESNLRSFVEDRTGGEDFSEFTKEELVVVLANLDRELEQWFVVDHDGDDEVIGGPYVSRKAAAEARRELERTAPLDATWNLWVVPEPPRDEIVWGSLR